MANFASLANEVVTILQELETAAETVGEKFLTDGPELENMAAKSKQQVKEVDEAVISLEQRVAQASENMLSQVSSLWDKLNTISEAADAFAQSTKDEMSMREDKVLTLDGEIEGNSAELDSLSDDVVKAIEEAKAAFNTSNYSMQDDFGTFEKQLERNQQSLDELVEDLEDKRNNLTNRIQANFIDPAEEYINYTDSEIEGYATNFFEEISDTNKIMSADLQQAVKLIQAAEDESRNEIKEMAQEVEEAYDSEQLDAASKQAQDSTQKMSDSIKQSETSFNQTADKLSETREVMGKMVG